MPILLVAAAQILVIGFLESAAIAGGASDIPGDTDKTARGKCRRSGIETVEHLFAGPAMRQHNARRLAVARKVERHPEKCADHCSVVALVMDDLRFRQPGGIDAGEAKPRQLRSSAGFCIHDPIVEWCVAGLMRDDDARAVR
jgi:hypothetical protein